MASTKYCAITGDIASSRLLVRRRRIQGKFLSTLEAINREFKSDIAARFVVIRGDEFQGLLKSPGESYRLVRRIQDLMDPVHLRFGIGLGSLSTVVESNVLNVDGEAFHRARAALVKAKQRKQAVIFDFDSDSLLLVNAVMGLLQSGWNRLTPRQRQIFQLVRATGGQEQVAKRLRISQPAVSKVISQFRSLGEAEDALYGFLTRL